VVYGTIRIDIGFRADLIVELADKRLGLLINFNAALIKDGISRIVDGLEEEEEEESHAKSQGRQEHQ